ncbi:hypothetical protein Hanom_Chr07g00624851 [Helianthus anomalus]
MTLVIKKKKLFWPNDRKEKKFSLKNRYSFFFFFFWSGTKNATFLFGKLPV